MTGDDDTDQARKTAEAKLRAWKAETDRRDELIRAASAAGVNVSRIQKLTGVARTTIRRILDRPANPRLPVPAV